jgi:hypothetical protein
VNDTGLMLIERVDGRDRAVSEQPFKDGPPDQARSAEMDALNCLGALIALLTKATISLDNFPSIKTSSKLSRLEVYCAILRYAYE